MEEKTLTLENGSMLIVRQMVHCCADYEVLYSSPDFPGITCTLSFDRIDNIKKQYANEEPEHLSAIYARLKEKSESVA